MEKNISKLNNEIDNLKLEVASLRLQLNKKENIINPEHYQNEYKSLYHNIPLGVMHYDFESNILDCNDSFVEIIGSDRNSLIGLNMFKTLIDSSLIEAIKQSLFVGKGEYEGVYKSTTSNKETPVKILFKALSDKKNKIYGGICIAEDLTDSIKHKEALIKSEENFRLIFENTTDVYFMTDKRGAILSMSPSVKDLLLLDNYENIVGKNVLQFYYNPDDREIFVNELLKNGVLHQYQVDLRRADGKLIKVESNSKVVYTSSGEIEGFIGVFYDVTSILEAEKEKLTNIWFFESLDKVDKIIRTAININQIFKGVAQAAISVFECDSSFVISSNNDHDSNWELEVSAISDQYSCDANQSNLFTNLSMSNELFDRITMYEKYVFIDGNNIFQLNDLSKNIGVKAQMITSLSLNSGKSIIFCISHCADERVWNKHEKALFKEISGRLIYAANAMESTELLLKSEEYHRTLIEATTEGYWEINRNGITTMANNAMCEILGFPMIELLGKSALVFTTHKSRQLLESVINSDKNELTKSFEIELQHKSGRIVHTLFSVTHRVNKDRNSTGTFFFVTDISNLKEALNHAEESDKLKSVFIKNISHEVRTPLNGIIGFLEILKDNELSKEKREEYTKYVMDSSDQLTTVITDILEYSRLEAGQIKCVIDDCSINSLLDELYVQFNSLIRSRNKAHIKFTVEKPLPNDKSIVKIDKVKVKQILANLINNAFKFTDNGSIKYGYDIINDNNIRLFVFDTGIGIPETDREIIFEKFRNGPSTTNPIYGGNGLGLSISKVLTELHGGSIWFESKVSVGTQFYVDIPLRS